MDLQKDLKELDEQLNSLRLEQTRLGARIEGLQAERDALSAALTVRPVEHDPDLLRMTKDRAIVAVLNSSETPMRIWDIVYALNAVGRNENYNGISVYLDTLLKQGRVKRVERGLYEAA